MRVINSDKQRLPDIFTGKAIYRSMSKIIKLWEYNTLLGGYLVQMFTLIGKLN